MSDHLGSVMFQAIPTIYDGHTFRSRLEARWALFFNFAGLPWEYEPEGFALELRGESFSYLPDFRLPSLGCWFEVKPEYGSFEESDVLQIARNTYSLARATQMPVYVAFGSLRDAEILCLPAGASFGEGWQVSWGRCAKCLAWGLGQDETEPRPCCGESCGRIGVQQVRGAIVDAHAFRFWEPM